MTLRRRILAAFIALSAIWSASLLVLERLVAAVRGNYLLDMLTGALWTSAFLPAALWIFRRRPAAIYSGTAATPKQFHSNPILWTGFAVSLFIVFVSAEARGSARALFLDRLCGTSPSATLTAGELAGQGAMYDGMAILFAWAAQAAVIVGLDVLAGERHGRIGDAATIDECARHLHAAGWSVGESCFKTDAVIVWQVDGTNGERVIASRGATKAGAWRAACADAFAKET